MPVKVKYSDKIRKKYKLPDYFQNKDEETTFWQNFDRTKNMMLCMDFMAERIIKKYGKFPRMEKVIRIRKIKKKK